MRQQVSIIGIPLHLGQGRRGVDLGVAAIRYANLTDRLTALGCDVMDIGDVPVPLPHSLSGSEMPDKLKNVKEIAAVSVEVATRVEEQLRSGRFPIILGGDHAIAIGSLAGVKRAVPRLGVIWFDAHTDINTDETTPSGNVHGMPLAVAIGMGHPNLVQVVGAAKRIDASNIVIVGARSIDPGEKTLLMQAGITVFTMHEIDRIGIASVMEEAIRIASRDTDGVHLSLDLDAFDPIEAPGVGTPVQGGLTYREGSLVMEMLAAANILTSVDVVEVNPLLDHRNRTAEVAVDMICSLLGERIM
ncbi:arginase [Paenibacillus marinisediminis]